MPTQPQPGTSPIVPRLKQAEWEGRDITLCQPLTNLADIPDCPLVAIGINSPKSIAFLNQDTLDNELHITAEKAIAKALQYLTDCRPEWQQSTLGNSRFLLYEHPFAAEQILNRAFLRAAHKRLRAITLAVSITNHGIIKAIRLTPHEDPTTTHAFIADAFDTFKQNPPGRITTTIFRVTDGQIVGHLAVPNADELLYEPPSDNDTLVKLTVEQNPNGTISPKLRIDAVNADSLRFELHRHIILTHNQFLTHPQWSGIITIEIICPPFPNLQAIIDTEQSSYDYMVQSTVPTTPSGRPMTLSIQTKPGQPKHKPYRLTRHDFQNTPTRVKNSDSWIAMARASRELLSDTEFNQLLDGHVEITTKILADMNEPDFLLSIVSLGTTHQLRLLYTVFLSSVSITRKDNTMRVLRYLLIATLLFLGLPVLAPLSLNAAPAAATLAATGAATASGPFNPNVVITSPLIVSELHGQVKVMGTANLPNMHNYFLETRLLNEDGSLPPDDVAWVPASLPSSTPVQDGLLATWDTTKVPAGVYELRLTVTTDNLPSAYFVVAPLRVNSEVAATQTANSGVTQGAPDAIPRVTANTTTYIRTGDSQAFAVLGYMQAGTGGVVLGVSSIGSGWYYVQLDNGVFGWVPPSAMTSSGDFSHVPPVVPPQSARRGPTPVSSNLVLNGMALSPSAPVCAGIFNVQVNVVNSGNTPSAAATVTVQDIHVASGTVTASGTGNVPSLNPNTNFVVVVSLTDTMYYNEAHLVRATVGNSQVTATYTLGQGSCNLTPTPTAASPTAVPPSPTSTTVPPTSTATTEPPSPTATVGTPSVP